MRQAPFTPRRQVLSVPETPRTAIRFPTHIRPQTPVKSTPDSSGPVKYKASLTAEARPRITTAASKPRTLSRPTSPLKNASVSRPTTPCSPSRRGLTDSPMLDDPNFDAESQLVDAGNVEPDLSADIDPEDLSGLEYKAEDKVLVSVRVRPTKGENAWNVQSTASMLKLKEQYTKTNTTPQEFRYDHVLTGSENKPVYAASARAHVQAAMDGYNAVVFAYGQTASGKTFTLTGSEDEPGIIPRAMKDVFKYIRRTPDREYLLRCSYLEIYNEQIHDLLSTYGASVPVQLQGIGDNVIITPLREEVVTSLKGVKEVIERGWGNRRTAATDWNERSSRSHSVFRLVIESRERGTVDDEPSTPMRPTTPGGSRLRSSGGRSVVTSVLVSASLCALLSCTERVTELD
jgi:centromeric protein E